MTPLKLGDKIVVMTTYGSRAGDYGPIRRDPTPIIEELMRCLAEEDRQHHTPPWDNLTVQGRAAVEKAKAWLEGKP